MRAVIALLAVPVMLLTEVAAATEAQLLMLERRGCVWCARWNAEIGTIYPASDLGRVAPLRRVDVDAPWPEDLPTVPVDRLTPTFILLLEGREIGRIRGYPGADFFWGLLERSLADAGLSP